MNTETWRERQNGALGEVIVERGRRRSYGTTLDSQV
jgi:hypothetical protein